MAEPPKGKAKRGRPKLATAEKSFRINNRKASFNKSRVYLGSEISRWNGMKTMQNFQTDREVATFLIDSYMYGKNTTVTPAASSPVSCEVAAKLSTPSLSVISDWESCPEYIDVEMADAHENSETSPVSIRSCMPETGRVHTKKPLTSSFIDPSEISMDVTEDESDRDFEDDPDYEPDIMISSALLVDVQIDSEDVAVEGAEFGQEAVEADQGEADCVEEVCGENIYHVRTDEDVKSVIQATKCLTFLPQLKQLATLHCDKCDTCNSFEIHITETFAGSAVYLKWVCNKGHVCLQWCSQPVLNRRLHVGDLAMCGTILTSGNNYGKLNLWASMLHLRFPTARQFQAIQGCYIVPTIDSFWSRHQSEILNSFQNIQVVVLGDGRNDSPGYSAQYCSYTLMELQSGKILTLKTLDKRVTERKSVNMEKAAFQLAMTELSDNGVSVKEVVTDAHLGIGSIMKTNYSHIHHSHDIWHVAKNLGKKLSKVAQKKGNSILHKWTKDILNHFWFTCKTAENYAQFVGIWRSVLHHVVNQHEWIICHGDDGINHCLHDALAEDERKPWLHPADNKDSLKDLAAVVLDKRLLGKVGYYLNFRSTGDLEVFHNHILMYCAKRYAYTAPVYRARNLLAAIDHNMHLNRPYVLNKDGSLRLQRIWNKKSGRWSVYQVREKKMYFYIDALLQDAVTMRMSDNYGMYKTRPLEADDPRRISSHLAPISPKPTKEIHLEQKSRFN